MSHDFPHRQTIRLPGYDYSRNGLYFVTICTHNRENLFGEIINGQIALNNAGEMIEKWYSELTNKFNNIKCHENITMPNHFHCIIEITHADHANTVGANLCVRPIHTKNRPIRNQQMAINQQMATDHQIIAHTNNQKITILKTTTNHQIIKKYNFLQKPLHKSSEYIGHFMHNSGGHAGPPLQRISISQIIQWFKTMTTNEYIRMVKEKSLPPFYGKIWQRNYHEHIIRNEKSYQIIAEYINTNPPNWESDSLYQKP